MHTNKIFKKYDIRGRFQKDFDLAFVTELAKAYCTFITNNSNGNKANTISIGYDARLSSPAIRDAFVKGVTESGFNALDIGLCPTPLLYFSLHVEELAGGVMITGSHNPPDYNGFKMCISTDSIFGDSIIELKDIIESGAFKVLQREDATQANYKNMDFSKSYIDNLKHSFSGGKKLRVAVDAGNGSGGELLVEALKNYNCEVFELFIEPDGRFPNHHPDPAKMKNMQDVINCVRENKLDLGIALDGDADRLGLVDKNGKIVHPDIYMILFIKEILARQPGATFIAEVKCSQALYDEVEKAGGNIIMYKTGHSLIKAKMKETGALLAGEMSGHIFFKDGYFGYDDALYSAMRLMSILKSSEKSLAELVAPYEIYKSTPELRIDVSDSEKFEQIDRLKKRFIELNKSESSIKEIITIDGVRVRFDDGWGLVRASNTEPHFVLRFEAISYASLERIKNFVLHEVDVETNLR